MFVNKYVKALKPYTLSSHKSWELPNEDVLKLDWNESTIPPSPLVFERIFDALENSNLNWYPDVNNIELLKSISEYTCVPIENVQYFASSDSLHEYIVRTFVENNDRVLIVAPTYDNFRSVVESNGALIDFYSLDKDFHFDLFGFFSYVDVYTPKIVYICNPNNPTGTIYTTADLTEIISKYEDILFVIDEAYYEFTGVSLKDLVIKYDNLIITRTFSKAFGLASFRVGYAISSQSNIVSLTKIRNPKNIAALSQVAALAALEDVGYMQDYVRNVKEAKTIFESQLRELGFKVVEGEGNFILFGVEPVQKEKILNFLSDNNVFIRNYSHVQSMDNFLRITIGTKEQMLKVYKLLEKVFS